MTGTISPRGAFIAPGMAVAAATKSAPIALDKTIIHGLIDVPSITRDRDINRPFGLRYGALRVSDDD